MTRRHIREFYFHHLAVSCCADVRRCRLTVTQQFNPHDLEGNVISDVFVIGDAAMLKDKLPATAQGERSSRQRRFEFFLLSRP